MSSIDENQQIIRDMTQSVYDEQREYTEKELSADTTWIEASKIAFQHEEGGQFAGTDEDAAKYGLEMMGKFNYNMALGTIPMAAKIGEANDEQKLAFYYMMDAYDKKDISTEGTARFFKNLALDPTTYVGIGSLGWGFAGRQAASTTARVGLKSVLKESAKKYIQSTTAIAATEGAMFTAAEDVARQEVAVQAGMQEEYDPTQTAVAGAIGAGAGAGLVKGGELIAKGVKAGAKQVGRWADEGEVEMMKMAGGGKPPEEYRISHTAPTEEGMNIGHDISDVYPDDVYSAKGRQYYGSGQEFKKADTESLNAMEKMRGNPEAEVTIYRAVPEWVDEFNDGDWITLSKDYANIHGSSWVEEGKYHVIEKKVKAKDVFTNGDSLNEWGYSPKEGEQAIPTKATEPIETLDPEIVQKYIGAKGEEKATASAKLDEALQKVEGDYEGVAIRGMLDTEGTLGKLEVGDDYTTRGVTSIAKDKTTADTFVDRSWDKEAKGEKVYVTFESFINKPVNLGEGNKLGFDNVLDPKGGKYSFLEDETVIPSGRKFEITKKEKIGDETHFTVKEVDKKEKQ